MSKRTCYAGDVHTEVLELEDSSKGWVTKRRSLGSLIFIDLRDREGIVTSVFSEDIDRDALTVEYSVRSEYVVEVTGVVKKRKPTAVNPEMKTGDIEVEVHDNYILKQAQTPPFYIEEHVAVTEETQLKYRVLDLRRPEMTKNIYSRALIMRSVQLVLDEHGFIDVETPTLTECTPEGAREVLVPSRVYPGSFYALPTSPQLLQTLLMGAGFDRY